MNFTVIGPVFPYRGGIAHYTSQLAFALSKAGHNVQVVSFKRQYPKWLYPGKSDKDPSQSHLQIEAEFLLDPINPLTWRNSAKRISNQKPDLVVIQWWTTFWSPAFAFISRMLQKKNIKVCYLIHNVYPHEPRFFDPMLSRVALSQGQVFIAQTEREKQKFLKLLPGRIINVCKLPSYTFLTQQKISREAARQKLGLPISRPLILFFGIVRPYKGLKYLLDAVAILKDRNRLNLPFLLVAGEIWENKSVYQEQIKHLGLVECVRLEDRYIPDEEVSIIFSAADMLVAPYVDGTQSAAVSLALGFDLPMVVTEIVAGGVSDENQSILRIVKAGDADSLARAIEQQIALPKTFTNRVHNGEKGWEWLINNLESFV